MFVTKPFFGAIPVSTCTKTRTLPSAEPAQVRQPECRKFQLRSAASVN